MSIRFGPGRLASYFTTWMTERLDCRVCRCCSVEALIKHHLDEMTPLCSIQKSLLQPLHKNTLRRAAAAKRPAASEFARLFKIVGGDNATESQIARVKSQLRRKNQLGRVSPKAAHVVQLAAAELLSRKEQSPQALQLSRTRGRSRLGAATLR